MIISIITGKFMVNFFGSCTVRELIPTARS
jgi:hypothetical protein